VALDVPVMPQPEAYIGGVGQLLGADGDVSNESTRALMTKFMNAYAAWIEATAKPAKA
jgi:chromate reductase